MPSDEKIERERVELGERLKQAREYLDLSQDEVARALKLPRAAVSMIESGQRKVEAIELKQFAKLYGSSVAYFAGDEVKSPKPSEDVDFAARAVSGLSGKDREELMRFAEFLRARPTKRK